MNLNLIRTLTCTCAAILAAGCSGSQDVATGEGGLSSGKILFAAHHSSDSSAAVALWVMGADGSGLTQLSFPLATGGSDYGTPDIEKYATGKWRLAYGQNGLTLYDTDTQSATAVGGAGATRADFNSGAGYVVYQMGSTDINIWKTSADGASNTQMTSLGSGQNAEWPYFNPATDQVLYFSTVNGPTFQHLMNSDGSSDALLASPANTVVSHQSVKADGSEFLNAQSLTSYVLATGAVGTLNSLKSTTTMMTQLSAMGYAEVPVGTVPGQANLGTFALSADWSRDGTQIVFDALVKGATSGTIAGIAVFVYTIASDSLVLAYGPEPFDGSRTNVFNYSIHTPKWVP